MGRVIRLDSTGSTNTHAATVADQLGHGDVVIARSQTAGRGQRVTRGRPSRAST